MIKTKSVDWQVLDDFFPTEIMITNKYGYDGKKYPAIQHAKQL